MILTQGNAKFAANTSVHVEILSSQLAAPEFGPHACQGVFMWCSGSEAGGIGRESADVSAVSRLVEPLEFNIEPERKGPPAWIERERSGVAPASAISLANC